MKILRLRWRLAQTVAGVALSGLLFGCANGAPGGGINPAANDPTGTGPGKQTLNGQVYKVLDGQLIESGEGIKGTGGLVFAAPRDAEDSNFALKFNLEQNGSLSLVSNSDPNLSSGVTLTFGRSADNKLTVRLSSAQDDYDLSEDFSSFSPAQTVELSVDVHGHGHVVLFFGNTKMEYTFEVRPKQLFWGLRLKNASVFSAQGGKAIEGGH